MQLAERRGEIDVTDSADSAKSVDEIDAADSEKPAESVDEVGSSGIQNVSDEGVAG